MRRSARILVVGAVAAVAAMVPIGGATASSGDATLGAGGNTGHRVSARAAQSAAEYWTPERMASARPVRVRHAAVAEAAAATAAGAPVQVPGSTGSLGAGAADEGPQAQAATPVPRPYTNLPDRLNGKVFFRNARDGLNYVCSGTVVNATNKSTVWTAGHCVHGGRGGLFHTNWTFVPAYSSSFNGHRPYGTYTARELWTRTAWIQTGTFRQDVGAAVLNRINNVLIVNRLGGQGIRFNFPAAQNYSSFGYPQAAPFNGQLQYRCNSPLLFRDNAVSGVGPAPMAINCNMTGGSSGGGWLTVLNAQGLGYVNSVNSYKYTNNVNRMYGPYHGNEALQLWNTVKVRPA